MKIQLRLFASNLESEVFTLQSHPSIEAEMVSRFVHHLKEQFPGNEFKVIKIARKRYNVIPLDAIPAAHA